MNLKLLSTSACFITVFWSALAATSLADRREGSSEFESRTWEPKSGIERKGRKIKLPPCVWYTMENIYGLTHITKDKKTKLKKIRVSRRSDTESSILELIYIPKTAFENTYGLNFAFEFLSELAAVKTVAKLKQSDPTQFADLTVEKYKQENSQYEKDRKYIETKLRGNNYTQMVDKCRGGKTTPGV